ncbi:MAG: VOC family protein [Actinobacteria bacterium]|nr:VOC family protein [Actinomycetota bacterium]
MIDHVAIPVRDLAASRTFYGPVLETLGAAVVLEWPGGMIFGTDDGMLALRERDQVMPVHVAFKADRAGVERFYAAALAAGGSDNGAPGIRSEYHEHYYAAFVTDPDGHNIEAVCHQPG